ncbi:MAG: iron complex outermembrane receptor protein [Halieaceae bacterium]|jgi:iron complex outermembrane receptor protein
MTQINLNKTLLAIAVTASLASTNVAAQMEEVIVTAQKRAESLQDTAIAITAISGDLMDDLNISDSSDYEAIVPSLSARDNPARLFLRGVGRVTNSLGTEPGVAVYIDQVYTPSFTVLGRANSLTTERIEVLRGPQGTLFGRNATGGALNITSKRPTEEYEHRVRAKVGNYDQQNWGVSSSGPITDSIGYRVYGYGLKHDGYIDNIGGDDIRTQDTSGYGAQFSWDISERVNWWVSYATDKEDYLNVGVSNGGTAITPYSYAFNTTNLFIEESFAWDRENPTLKDAYKVDLNDPLRVETDTDDKWVTHVTWDLDNVTLKYIGSYFENDTDLLGGDLGFTSNPNNRIVESSISASERTSHELQILSTTDGPLQWVAGIYYLEEELDQPYFIQSLEAVYLDNTLPLTGADPSFNPADIRPNVDRQHYFQRGALDSKSQAVYLDANYTFNEQWKLTAGIRYSEDEKDGFEELNIVIDSNLFGLNYPSFGFPEACCGLLQVDKNVANRDLEDDWSNVSGRVVLDYVLTDNQMLYASVSNGYKAGGFRLGTLQNNPSFDEEELVSYEIGYKGTLGDTLRLNAAAYFYDYEGMQVLVPRLSDAGIPLSEIVNVDQAEVKGVELEATWLATESLMIMANYSYIDGEYTDFCCAVDTLGDASLGEQDLSGNPLTQAPENKFYVNASYSWQTSSAGEFVLTGSYTWVDERQYDVFNPETTIAEHYYRVDALVSWLSPSQTIRVILSGKNLTEEETYTSIERTTAFGSLAGAIGAPRTYGLEVQFDF